MFLSYRNFDFLKIKTYSFTKVWQEESQWSWSKNHGLPGFNLMMHLWIDICEAKKVDNEHKMFTQMKLACSGWRGSVWRVASHLRSSQVGGMEKNKIIIHHCYQILNSWSNQNEILMISCKILHHYKYLCILRREVVTKQTEGYSQQQQEEEEEILVFQVQSSRKIQNCCKSSSLSPS